MPLSGFLKSLVLLAVVASLSRAATGNAAEIATSLSAVNFGTVTAGEKNSQPITISNAGTGSLTISRFAVTGTAFSILELRVPLVILAGGRASFDVAFQPVSAAAFSGSIALYSNARESPLSISLAGRGALAIHSLTVSPTSLAFGSVNVGKSSTQNIRLTNTGNAEVTISAVSMKGPGFSGGGVNSGLMLKPNQTADLSVSFGPTAGGAASGSVTIVSNAVHSPQSVSLLGTGTASPPQPGVALSWIASSSSGVTGYNVYRGTVPNQYSKLNSNLIAETFYTDETVQTGKAITYYYVVTAVNSKGEQSADSDPVAVLVP